MGSYSSIDGGIGVLGFIPASYRRFLMTRTKPRGNFNMSRNSSSETSLSSEAYSKNSFSKVVIKGSICSGVLFNSAASERSSSREVPKLA